jgi:hypothetical protein
MPNPLTFYIPVKQDSETQAMVSALGQGFSPSANQALFSSQIVHYARIVAVPNPDGKGAQAIMVITEFDNAMAPYVKFFFDEPDINKAFTGIAMAAVNPPRLPLELNDFTSWVIKNNLTNDANTLFSAYPQTVKQIQAKFPPQ